MTAATIPDYVTPKYLAHLQLRSGGGTGEPGDRCAVQEVRAWLGLNPKSDACPPSVDPIIHRLVITMQDRRADWRQEIVFLLPKLPGSKGSDALQWHRLYRLSDWQTREALPAIMDLYPSRREEAAKLRALEAIVDPRTAKLAADQLDLALASALNRARTLDINRARTLALDLSLALDFDPARDLDLTLDRDLARDLDRDLARVLDRARDLARTLARASAFAFAYVAESKLPSPVDLIAELLAMRD